MKSRILQFDKSAFALSGMDILVHEGQKTDCGQTGGSISKGMKETKEIKAIKAIKKDNDPSLGGQIIRYLKKDTKEARALYCALSGREDVEKVKFHQNETDCFLSGDGGAIFVLTKKELEHL